MSLLSKIGEVFVRLQCLLQELGLSVSVKKLVPSSTKVTCLGIVIDSIDLSVSIAVEKLQSKFCVKIALKKSSCTKVTITFRFTTLRGQVCKIC